MTKPYEDFNIRFEYICEITPFVNAQKGFIEYYPYKEYKNEAQKKLHKYGKGPFCKFQIPNGINKAGVYILKVNEEVKYVGECENLSSRYNMGYGQISPRNCFVGGQSTNCKINSYILREVKNGSKVHLLFYETENRFEVERNLIKKYEPDWNATSGKYINAVEMKPVNYGYKEVKSMGNVGKYYLLEKYLDRQSAPEITLTFPEIERIIGEPLPASAYKYPAWWANGGHIQADAWLNAGWKVGELKLGESVVFVKDKQINTRTVKTGKKYRHFKGNEYLVLHLAKHSETLEDLVVYQAMYGEQGIWVRPLAMFLEQVKVEGKLVNRFEECD
ncbi:MAG: hypothetical protein PWQ70_801 [Clostridiales bacterium]|nr:hypothetical protein [Clostridiales bacterium]